MELGPTSAAAMELNVPGVLARVDVEAATDVLELNRLLKFAASIAIW